MKRRSVWCPASSLDEGQRLRRVAPMNESFNWGVFISSMCLGKTLLLARGSQLTVTVSSSSWESTSLTTRCNSCCVFENICKTTFHTHFCFVIFFFFPIISFNKSCAKIFKRHFWFKGSRREMKRKKTGEKITCVWFTAQEDHVVGLFVWCVR